LTLFKLIKTNPIEILQLTLPASYIESLPAVPSRWKSG